MDPLAPFEPDTIAVEGCNIAQLIIELSEHTSEDIYVPLLIEGSARNGVDYDTIPDSILIPKGQRFAYVDIVAWEDNIPEGVEMAIISYDQNSPRSNPELKTTTFHIYDKPEFTMNTPEFSGIHCSDTVRLYTVYDGGLPPFSYYWFISGNHIPFDSVARPKVHPDSSTTYIVHQSDACGDLQIDSIFIEVMGPVATVSSDTSICLGGFASLKAGGGTSYYWEPGGYNSDLIKVSPEENTMYTVTVYDDCNNSDTDSVWVYVDSPQAYAGEDVSICPGEIVTLTASGGEDYLWNTGENTRSIEVRPENDECYIVFVTDACNNTVSDTVCVFVDHSVQADAGPDQEICAGDTIVLMGSGGNECLWNTGDSTYQLEVSPEETSTYCIHVFGNCSDQDSVTVFVNPRPQLTATADENHIITGESITLHAGGADSYFWSAAPPDPSLSGQEHLQNPVVSPTEPLTVYTLTGINDQTSCSNTAALNIIIVDPISSDFSFSANEGCTGEEIRISYTEVHLPGAEYEWDFDGGQATGPEEGPYEVCWNEAGEKNISLKVYLDGFESELTQKTLHILSAPEVDFSSDIVEACAPANIQFKNLSTGLTDHSSFSWSFGNGEHSNVQEPAYVYKEAGIYSVSLQVTNDICKDSKSLEQYISVYDSPDADFSLSTDQTTTNEPEIFVDDHSTGDPHEWIWDMGDGTVIYNEKHIAYKYEDAGNFNIRLIVYNNYGCWDSLSKMVQIHSEPKFFAPNAFRPGSTHGNDKFRVRASGVEKFSLFIFSRWGEKVFETDNLDEGWNGTINGEIAPTGTYIYQINYTNDHGQNDIVTGTVTLVK
ncbi:MAG: gliding motility-associated C-terminal domain-containing protein [Bacteroidales bacterium]|nr:gliding motility-associated C-terminal domain-containing protein [Bacteroidales bacterium]MCF8398858.1 gliding motility-associated C-terminal domain-containing protein [Bacteroidales bacterium]